MHKIYGNTLENLIWALSSPPLLNARHEDLKEYSAAGSLIDQMDCSKLPSESDLNEFIDHDLNSYRLGLYFETLIAYGLKISGIDFKKNLSIRVRTENKTDTLGALDFIFFDRNKNSIHMETALKFYLCREIPNGGVPKLSDYIGPNAIDRFDKKLTKLLNTQLALSQNSDIVKDLLHAFHHAYPPLLHLLVKGRLFYHLSTDWKAHPHPEIINPKHQRGWWIKANEIGQLDNNKDFAFKVLVRYEWMTDQILIKNESELISFKSLSELVKQSSHDSEDYNPLQVAIIDKGAMREISRGFILEKNWPGC